MKPSGNYFDRAKIEFLVKEERHGKHSKFISTLNRIWQLIIIIFTKQNELRVWQQADRFGHTRWNAYDPFTGKSATFVSQSEMLAWIEQYYAQ